MYLTVVAGLADQVVDAAAGAAVSNRAMAAVSGRMAEGLGNGVMLMRLGRAIKCECRPLELDDRSSLLAQLTALVGAIWHGGAETPDSPAGNG